MRRLLALPAGGAAPRCLLAVVAVRRARPRRRGAAAERHVEAIGRLLFTDYLFPFELTSVLLLAAMVGVLLLARRRA